MRFLSRTAFLSLAAAGAILVARPARIAWGKASDTISPDGTITIKELSVPLSSLLSPEAKAYMIHLLRDHPFAGGPSAEQDIKG